MIANGRRWDSQWHPRAFSTAIWWASKYQVVKGSQGTDGLVLGRIEGVLWAERERESGQE